MAKNNHPHSVTCGKSETIMLHTKLKGGGASAALTVNEPFKMGSIVKSITRSSLGTFAFVFTDTFPQTIKVLRPYIKSTTVGLQARWSALDLGAGTGTLVCETWGGATIPAWSGNVATAADAIVLTTPGAIVAVELQAGGVTGAGNLRKSAPANSRDVQVTYDASGVPTITFLAGDAVTAGNYLQLANSTLVDPATTDDIYFGFLVRNSGQH